MEGTIEIVLQNMGSAMFAANDGFELKDEQGTGAIYCTGMMGGAPIVYISRGKYAGCAFAITVKELQQTIEKVCQISQ